MPDLDLLVNSEQLPNTANVRHKEIATNVYALVGYAVAAGVNDAGVPLSFKVDDRVGALVTVNEAEHTAHNGVRFVVSYLVPHGSLLADDATLDIAMIIGPEGIHISPVISVGGNCEVFIHEGAVLADTGTPLEQFNKDRSSANISNEAVTLNPTVTVLGLAIHEIFAPGGTGIATVGGSSDAGTEWTFRPNTTYLIRINNRAGVAIQVSIRLEWAVP